MSDDANALPTIVQDRKDGGKRILCDCDNHEEYDGQPHPMTVINGASAINYIAYGRFEGPPLERYWTNVTPKWIPMDEDYQEGRAATAQRVLERAIRRGELTVYEADDDGDAQMLWKIDPAGFVQAVWLQGYSERGLADWRVHGLNVEVKRPFFEASAIREMADPADDDFNALDTRTGQEVPDEADEQPKPKKRNRSHTRNYGTPNGTLAARLLTMPREEAVSITTDELGYMLGEEFKAAGFEPLNTDTMRQMATGLRAGLLGLGA